jgi:hypothetical protein
MAANEHDQRFLVVALIFSLVAVAVMVSDNIVNRQTFDLLQLIFSVVALVCGVIVIARARRRPSDEDEQVIDLRERLVGLVDLDDVDVDRAMDVEH